VETEATPFTDIVVQSRGDVSMVERGYAREKIGRARKLARAPVLFTRVDLALEPDPARDQRASAKAEIDVNGSVVRAHVSAETMFAAIDALEQRIRHQFERAAQLERSKHLRHRDDSESEWRHGSAPARRAASFPRPVEERQLLRRKTFSVSPRTVDEAVADLEALDHDFFLFTNTATAQDCVVARAADGGYELVEPVPSTSAGDAMAPVVASPLRPSTLSEAEAMSLLDLGDEHFVFFLDAESGRGRVLYRRYDGHYGLIVPSDDGRNR